jgi:hypothetical protein
VILFPWDGREGIFSRHENRMGNKNPVDGDFREQIYKIYKFTNLQKLHEGVPPISAGILSCRLYAAFDSGTFANT